VRVVFPAIPSAGQIRAEALSRATGAPAKSTAIGWLVTMRSNVRVTTDVTISGIGFDQSAAPFSLGTGSPVDASVPCPAWSRIARSGWLGF